MSFHWWRNPGASYLACLLVLILIGIGGFSTFREELSTAQRLQRDILDLNEQMVNDLARWERQMRGERKDLADERLAHQAFQAWVMQTFPSLRQARKIDQQAQTIAQLEQRLTVLELETPPLQERR